MSGFYPPRRASHAPHHITPVYVYSPVSASRWFIFMSSLILSILIHLATACCFSTFLSQTSAYHSMDPSFSRHVHKVFPLQLKLKLALTLLPCNMSPSPSTQAWFTSLSQLVLVLLSFWRWMHYKACGSCVSNVLSSPDNFLHSFRFSSF